MSLETKGIVFYDSVKDMPAYRYTEMQKMVAYDLNVGSNFSDVLAHLNRVLTLAGKKDIEGLSMEITNLHNNYYFLLEGLNFTSLAFACLVKSIDGCDVEVTDEDSVKRISEQICKKLSQQEVEDNLDIVKKNLQPRLVSTSQMVLMMMKQSILQTM